MDKITLRREITKKKAALSAAQIEYRSRILAERLFESPLYRRAKALFAYLSFNQEVRTYPIIKRAWSDGKRVAVPRIVRNELVFIWIDSFDSLVEGRFGIPEPSGEGPIAEDCTALILMPGLAFDRKGNRLGYGGGYYDRYLAAHPGHPLAALCYDFQLVDRLEVETHDIPMDAVITDAQRPVG